MGAQRKAHTHADVRLSCEACDEEIQRLVGEGVEPGQFRAKSPALWEHLESCSACAEMRLAELLRLVHEEGHEGHREERVLRWVVVGVVALVFLLVVLLSAAVVRWGQRGEEASVRQIYRQAGPAIVRIAAAGRTGSGMIFDQEGHILTNNHVVEGADEISVRLADGVTINATVVGQDLATDLAVLQANTAGHPTSVIHFGDSNRLKVGDLAIVIGNPFDLERSLSVGHISALNRILSTKDPYGAQIYGGIQTDAAINPGNSGGPLFNSAGAVVGITTSIVPGPSGGSVGVGFAVPINTARQVISEILARGYVSRPYLGVIGRPLMTFEASRSGFLANEGVMVSRVDPGSPAERVGLQAGARSREVFEPDTPRGDVILAVDGHRVRALTELWRLLQEHAIGDEATLTVLRAGKVVDLIVQLEEQPR